MFKMDVMVTGKNNVKALNHEATSFALMASVGRATRNNLVFLLFTPFSFHVFSLL